MSLWFRTCFTVSHLHAVATFRSPKTTYVRGPGRPLRQADVTVLGGGRGPSSNKRSWTFFSCNNIGRRIFIWYRLILVDFGVACFLSWKRRDRSASYGHCRLERLCHADRVSYFKNRQARCSKSECNHHGGAPGGTCLRDGRLVCLAWHPRRTKMKFVEM